MTTLTPAPTEKGGLVPLQMLRQRAEFLRCAKGRSERSPGFVLQARHRGSDALVRVGFTCSKKVGNAVARNRAKRRLREIARREIPRLGMPGWDYVLIGRREVTAALDFTDLTGDLAKALERLHR